MESKLRDQGTISEMLHQAMELRIPVSIALSDSIEELRVIGIIEGISEQFGKFKVEDDWFFIDDIEGIELMYAQHQ